MRESLDALRRVTLVGISLRAGHLLFAHNFEALKSSNPMPSPASVMVRRVIGSLGPQRKSGMARGRQSWRSIVNSFPTKICMVEHVLFPPLPTTINITI